MCSWSCTGNADLTISAAGITGAGFSTTGLSTPLVIPGGQSSTFSVKFAPAAAGSVTGNVSLTSNASPATTTIPLSGTGQIVSGGVSHLLYICLSGSVNVYDIDNGHRLVKTLNVPQVNGPKGAVASTVTRTLYISYGGQGGSQGNGGMLAYDLMADKVVWNQNYSHGIDSMAITPDGKTIYMPDGEGTGDANWFLVDSATGQEKGTISGGHGPHNTVVSLNGAHVYLGGRNENNLYVGDTSSNQTIRKIGPLIATNIVSGNGVRPFTINGKETLSFTTASGWLGFQVGDINTGKVLYSVTPQGFSWDGTGPSTPSHGITLSPDEKELYLLDWNNDFVHVFDITGLPGSAPVKVADIHLNQSFNDIGWLTHSRDGRFVYVGNTGVVIDTATRQVMTGLPLFNDLFSSRWFLEIDWSGGVPVFAASTRAGLGYVTQ